MDDLLLKLISMYQNDGTLILDIEKLQLDSVKSLFEDMEISKMLKVTELPSKPEKIENRIIFRGKVEGNALLATAQLLTFAFLEHEHKIEIIITIPLSPGSLWSERFPDLKNSPFWRDVQLSEHAVSLRLASADGMLDIPGEEPLQAGINFLGNFDFSTGGLVILRWLEKQVNQLAPAKSIITFKPLAFEIPVFKVALNSTDVRLQLEAAVVYPKTDGKPAFTFKANIELFKKWNLELTGEVEPDGSVILNTVPQRGADIQLPKWIKLIADICITPAAEILVTRYALEFGKLILPIKEISSDRISGHFEGGTLEQLCDAVGFQIQLPDSLNSISNISFIYEVTKGTFVLTAERTAEGDKVVLAGLRNDDNSWIFAISCTMDRSISLADLPMVKGRLPAAESVSIQKFQILIPLNATAVITINEIKQLNELLLQNPAFPEEDLNGAVLRTEMSVGNTIIPLHLMLAELTSNGSSPSNLLLADAGGKTKWCEVQRTLGPLLFKRIGLRLVDDGLDILVDGSLTIDVLTVSLLELSVHLPFQSFKPEFRLNGIGVDYEIGPMEVGGTFLRSLEKASFDGGAVVKASEYSLDAVGSYTELAEPSLFVFMKTEGNFGGPPFMYITALTGGLGYNRTLRVPEVYEVDDFPLLQEDLNSDKAIKNLQDQHWIEPALGEHWLAVGMNFTTYQFVKSRAVLAAIFGRDFELALLGISNLTIPESGGPKFADITMQLRAIIRPAEGLFGISGELMSESYVLHEKCELTGGFALYAWFGDSHKGDFVLSVGGYHPAFQKPAHYPTVPRLGYNWSVEDNLTIKGESYFAITPDSLMGGCSLEVLFHAGSLRAWFRAVADFFAQWKPFNFCVDVGIRAGMSFRARVAGIKLHFEVEIGADLELWGSPIGGRAMLGHRYCKLTVGFGAPKESVSDNSPVRWKEFRSLLPKNPCTIRIAEGLVRKEEDIYVVRPDQFKVVVDSAIPVKKILVDEKECSGDSVYIRPMNLNLQPTYKIKITLASESFNPIQWRIDPRKSEVPSVLWGISSDAKLISHLTGVSIASPRENIEPLKLSIPENLLYHDLTRQEIRGEPEELGEPFNAYQSSSIVANIMNPDIKMNRQRLLESLTSAGVYQGPKADGSLNRFATEYERYIPEPPNKVKGTN
ncbi:hypothetical protein COJ51_16210 [Bacillus thuringiensis]|uniref:DUF6603 domain-containing protein n=1 Tax=Bacillus thuringiensis TaxID=1428 RepID=UPI000BF766BF|nr:DUF6603 domain-containing protein [Bacillus thuringiensis]PFN03468.1 hypothetical protein COJ51_16210 [Bacillus thuringiensis]